MIYPLSLLQLLIEFIEGLAVFLSHLTHLVFVKFGLVIQTLFEVCHLCLTLGPEMGEQRLTSLFQHVQRTQTSAHYINFNCCCGL